MSLLDQLPTLRYILDMNSSNNKDSVVTNNNNFSDYFLQSSTWTKAWETAQVGDHKIIDYIKGVFKSKIYQYPWHGGIMWYLAKGPVIGEEFTIEGCTKEEFVEYLSGLYELAKKKKVKFLKLDLNDNITNFLGLDDKGMRLLLEDAKLNCNYSADSLQYTQCAILPLSTIPKIENYKELNLEQFVNIYEPLLRTFSKTRRYEMNKVFKKYLDKQITFKTDKSKETFDDFWKVHIATAERQNIATNPSDYNYRMLKNNDFVHILVGYDAEDKPCCGWYGVALGDTLTYLLGGNNDVSIKNQYQHMLHIQSLYYAYINDYKYYDFGGYDKNFGYGMYKDRFNPIIRTFLSPVDIIIDPISYNLYRLLKKIKNKLKR